jgi:hypothetical protein
VFNKFNIKKCGSAMDENLNPKVEVWGSSFHPLHYHILKILSPLNTRILRSKFLVSN